MKIQILGTGCPKCQQLADHAQRAATELGIDHEVVKITEMNDILAFGIMTTPGLAFDDQVKSAGKVLSIEKIKGLLSEEAKS